MSKRTWLIAVPFFLAAALHWPTPAAEASSRLCRQLEQQLVQAERGGDRQARRYAAAAEKQRAHLARARAQARQAGCGLFSGQACANLNAIIRRMERNLAQIERHTVRGGPSRATILARLDANGCREPPTRRQARAEQRPQLGVRGRMDDPDLGHRGPSLLERLFSNGQRERPAPPIEPRRPRSRTSGVAGGNPDPVGGTFRTMCVRPCDGYFFPMSFNSSPADFDRDRTGCKVMCPGAETRLYAHRLDQESEEMVSTDDGAPYTSLATAFAYKDASFARPEGCRCRAPAKNYTIIAGEGQEEPAQERTPPLPSLKPDPAADPDSAYDMATGLGRETIVKMLTDKPLASESAGSRAIRVVGPRFLPDQEAAIDLRAPGRPELQ